LGQHQKESTLKWGQFPGAVKLDGMQKAECTEHMEGNHINICQQEEEVKREEGK
jgi:hypothetical protein